MDFDVEYRIDEKRSIMKKIIVLGDSTTSEYTMESFPQQGWAYFLPKYVKAGVEIKNFAQGGASLKSFLFSPDYIAGKTAVNEPEKSKWHSVILPEVSEGDIVIFYWAGINDMLQSSRDGFRKKEGGAYVRDEQNLYRESYIWIGEGLGTHTYFTLRSEVPEMSKLLQEMVEQVQCKKAIPVIVRGSGKYYKVREQDRNVIAVNRKYADAVIDVAKACGVIYFDVGVEIEKEFLNYGYEKTAEKYLLPISIVKRFCAEREISRSWPYVDDNVHYNYRGAEKICQMLIEQMEKSDNQQISRMLITESIMRK